MLDPKGNLVTLVGFDPSGNIVPLQVTADGFLIANYETSGAGAGTMLEPKGNLVTPVAFDPSGSILPIQVTADGYLRVSVENLPPGGYTEGCRVYNSSGFTTQNNVLFTLTFNAESYDTDGIHSTISNPSRLTCQHAGKYIIFGIVTWVANGIGDRVHFFQKNGTGDFLTRSDVQPLTAAGNATTSSLATIADLAAGDYIEFKVRQGSGGNLNIDQLGNYSPSFGMQRVG